MTQIEKEIFRDNLYHAINKVVTSSLDQWSIRTSACSESTSVFMTNAAFNVYESNLDLIDWLEANGVKDI